ncbi:MAG: OsmC family protein, partial [Candidatus Halalkalibacterium sp. M3_1C_030]
MPQRKANAIWKGDLKGGKGTMKFGSGAFEGSYSFASRFEEGTGTNPEELIGAAHAGCYSMALSGDLAKAGFTPESVETNANVTLEMVDGAPKISKIKLTVKANIPDIEDDKFQELAKGAKENCPVSKV